MNITLVFGWKTGFLVVCTLSDWLTSLKELALRRIEVGQVFATNVTLRLGIHANSKSRYSEWPSNVDLMQLGSEQHFDPTQNAYEQASRVTKLRVCILKTASLKIEPYGKQQRWSVMNDFLFRPADFKQWALLVVKRR